MLSCISTELTWHLITMLVEFLEFQILVNGLSHWIQELLLILVFADSSWRAWPVLPILGAGSEIFRLCTRSADQVLVSRTAVPGDSTRDGFKAVLLSDFTYGWLL